MAPTSQNTERYVLGVITDQNGNPVPGCKVAVLEFILGSNRLLSEGVTDDTGNYEIKYTISQCYHSSENFQEIFISVYENELLKGRSDTIAQTGEAITINKQITIGDKKAVEYMIMMTLLNKHLASVDILLINDPVFLNLLQTTGADLTMAWDFINAKRLKKSLGQREDFLYALMREGLSPVASELLHTPTDVKRSALENAIQKGIVEVSGEQEAIDLENFFLALDLLKESYPYAGAINPATSHYKIGKAIRLLKVTPEEQVAILGFWLNFVQSTDSGSFERDLKNLLSPLEAGWFLSFWSGHDLDDRLMNPGFPLEHFRDFGKMSIEDWGRWFYAESPATTSFAIYQKGVSLIKEYAHLAPTAYMVSSLRNKTGYPLAEAVRWLLQNPRYDFRFVSASAYLSTHSEVTNDFDIPALQSQLLRLEKAFHLARKNPFLVKTIIDKNFDDTKSMKSKNKEQVIRQIKAAQSKLEFLDVQKIWLESGLKEDSYETLLDDSVFSDLYDWAVPYTVSGKVASPDSKALPGLKVAVFHVGKNGELLLGDAETSKEGNYKIEYNVQSFFKNEEKTPNLRLRVYKSRKELILLSTSGIFPNVKYTEKINLVADPKFVLGATEFAMLDGNLPFDKDLSVDDHYNWANKVAKKIVADFKVQKLPAGDAAYWGELLYGMLRAGGPYDPVELIHLTDSEQTLLISGATQNGVIKPVYLESIGATLLELERLKSVTFDPAMAAKKAKRAAMGYTLFLSGADEASQKALYEKYIAAFQKESDPDLVLDQFLKENKGTVPFLQSAWNFVSYFGYHQDERRKLNDLNVNSVSDLARLKTNQYLILFEKQLAGKPHGEKMKFIAGTQGWLYNFIKNEIATQYLAASLSAKKDFEFNAGIRFLHQYPSFRLGSDTIDTYLESDTSAIDHSYDLLSLKSDLYLLQRVFNLAAMNPVMAEALLLSKLDSSEKIKRISIEGKLTEEYKNFITQYVLLHYADLLEEFDGWQLQDMQPHIFLDQTVFDDLAQRAAAQYNYLISLIGYYNDLNKSPLDISGAVRSIPQLKDLFGSLNYAACEHCRSVLSPAAYLVDALNFLIKVDGNNGLTQFLLRRPDIKKLELNCGNTHETLPYLEIVNEILEQAVMRTATENSSGEGSLKVTGKVLKVSKDMEEVIKDIRIEAVIGHPRYGETVATASSIGAADFELLIDPVTIRKKTRDMYPDLFFRAYQNDRLIYLSTAPEIKKSKGGHKQVTLKVAAKAVNEYDISASFWLRGTIRHSVTKENLKGLTVEAWEKDSRKDDFLGLTTSSVNGYYSIRFDQADYRERISEYAPDIYFKIYAGETLILNTRKNKSEKINFQSREAIRNFEIQYTPNEVSQTVSQGVSTILNESVYPWKFPVDLAYEEMRLWLDSAGIKKEKMPDILTPGIAAREEESALNLFAISPAEADVLYNKSDSPAAEVHHYFGLSDGEWLAKKKKTVTEILEKTGLSLEQLSELLSTFFVNPKNREIDIESTQVENTWQIASTVSITAKELDRLHRFVRLSRKTGWSFIELDQLIRALNAQDINRDLISELRRVKVIQSELNLQVGELFSLLNHLDVRSYLSQPSDYASLFAGEKTNGENTITTGFEFDLSKNELKITDNKFYEPENLLNRNFFLKTMKALGISDEMLKYIVDTELRSNKIDYFNLCHLHRIVTLCKGLKISCTDFTILRIIANIKADQGFSLAELSRFIETHRRIVASGFSLRETEFLLCGITATQSYLSDAAITSVLATLANELRPLKEIDPGQSTEERQRENIIANVLSRELVLDRALIVPVLKTKPMGFSASIIDLLAGNNAFLKEEITPKIFPELYHSVQWIYKVKLIAGKLGINDKEFVQLTAIAPAFGIYTLASLPIANTEVPKIEQWLGFIKAFSLHKKYAGKEGQNTFDFLEKNLLPSLSAGKPKNPDTLWVKNVVAAIRAHFGWPEESIDFVLKNLARYEIMLMSLEWLYLIEKIQDLCSASGHRVQELATIQSLMKNPSEEGVGILKQLLQSKVESDRWSELAKVCYDRFLERKRDVMRDYLLANNPLFKDANDIYSYYLIDTEMSSAAETSRIVQAISSVQLFVQRISMSLEEGLKLTPENQREWQWRKNYRVWEANRKVFLYPENWLLPELRKNRTPFFDELIDELNQSPVTDEALDNLFVKYLNKLNVISSMEASGLYNDREDESRYIFARTRENPHRYFFTQMVRGKYWTPWNEIDTDIQGDHLIPAKHNNRLMLIWPQFSDKAEKPSPINVSPAANSTNYTIVPPVKFNEIDLGYSVFENGKWSSKKVSVVKLKGEKDYTLDQYHMDLSGTADIKVSIGIKHPSTIAGDYKRSTIGNFQLRGRGEVTKEEAVSPSESLYPYNHGASLEYGKFVQTGQTVLTEYYLDKFQLPVTSTLLKFSARKFHTLYACSFNKNFRESDPFIYEDAGHTFYVNAYDPNIPTGSNTKRKYKFQLLYHPFTRLFMDVNSRYGIRGLLNAHSIDASSIISETYRNQISALRRQQIRNTSFKFKTEYAPQSLVDPLYPEEDIDFSATGIYSEYNWELFFHIPMTLALEFSKNKQFEKAQKWFHYIFDPTMPEDYDTKIRFWKIKPFYAFNEITNIADLLKLLNMTDESLLSEEEKKQRADLLGQIDLWEEQPFDPHVIARFRIVSYMKSVVMKYLDNLISWGDHLFTMDSTESINEATQLYILASQILGKKPQPVADPQKYTLTVEEATLQSKPFSNALADIEARFPLRSKVKPPMRLSEEENPEALSSVTHLYFCIPPNEKLLEYWDVVEDRLFKIRHCMNIKGVKRNLLLFQPPLDPSMLVRAAARGIDLGSILSEPAVTITPYRFTTMIQKANEMVNQVKSLGANLLAALEKQDSEAMSLIRAGQELKVLGLMRLMKAKAAEEATKNYEGLLHTEALAKAREDYYSSRVYMNDNENIQLDRIEKANELSSKAQDNEILAGYFALLPNVSLGINGVFGSPASHIEFGGPAIAAGIRIRNAYLNYDASQYSNEASIAAIKGGYDRRKDDWDFQTGQAKEEQLQTRKQIEAAQARLLMAQRDLEVHDQQTENAAENEGVLAGKYTNKELYQWMVSEISKVYFQSYQLAYQVAKKAEKAYAYELGVDDPDFVEFGYWDNLKKGLMSGEKLEYDLKQLEMSYYDNNVRCAELTKHISLGLHFPHELLRLKQSGQCDFVLPEVLFDMDHPGHYARRIKSVALTIPCITGPYTNVCCELTLTRSQWRKKDFISANLETYPWLGTPEDDRFHYQTGTSKSIATSSGQNDSGIFELNFRDERYLPFEGYGAISQWHLEFPEAFRQFNYDSISDVVIHIQYTSMRGASVHMKQAAQLSIARQLERVTDYFEKNKSALKAYLDYKNFFPDALRQLSQPRDGSETVQAEIDLSERHFPYFLSGKNLKLKGIGLILKMKTISDLPAVNVSIAPVKNNPSASRTFSHEANSQLHLAYFETDVPPVGKWKIKLSGDGLKILKTEDIDDFILIVDYIIS